LTAEGFFMTDPETDQLRLVEYRDYAARVVRSLYPTPAGLRRRWREALGRAEIEQELANRGIDFGDLAARTGLADMDPFDLLVHVAWNEPQVTRYDRARQLRRAQGDFFQRFQPEARVVLDLLLERYARYGDDIADMDVLRLEPVSELGTQVQIAERFGTFDRMRNAIEEMQHLLYAA
jgi:type I restriction enzyme, R subunit